MRCVCLFTILLLRKLSRNPIGGASRLFKLNLAVSIANVSEEWNAHLANCSFSAKDFTVIWLSKCERNEKTEKALFSLEYRWMHAYGLGPKALHSKRELDALFQYVDQK